MVERAPQLGDLLERADQEMAGADLRLAEEQRRVVPAAVEHVDDLVGDLRHLGLVLAEAVDGVAEVRQQLGAVELEVIGRQR